MKSTVIEFQMALLIKSLAAKYLSFGEKGKEIGKIIRGERGKKAGEGEKGERHTGEREERGGG